MEVELSIDEAMKGSGGGVDYAASERLEGPGRPIESDQGPSLDALLGSLSGQALRLAKTPPRQ